jgi:polysaccharide chain length determinant protein (PEP-CTERM system associated)
VIPGKSYTPELILSIAWRRKWLIAIPAVLVATMGFGIAHLLPDRYRAEAAILVVPQRVPENFVRPTVTTRVDERLRSINQQVRTRSRLERIILDFNLYPERRQTDIMQDIVEDMNRNIHVDIVQGDIFRVGFSAENPRTAKDVTDSLVSFFIDASLKDRAVQAEGTSTFLETELDAAGRKLREVEDKIADYKRRHDGELPTQAEANYQGLQGTEFRLQTVNTTIERLRDERARLQRHLADLTAAADSAAAAPLPVVPEATGPRTKAGELAAKRVELAQLRLKYERGWPSLDRLEEEVAQLEKEAELEAASATPLGMPPAPAVNPILASRLKQIDDTRTDIASTETQINRLLEEQKSLTAQSREYERRIQAAPIRDTELAALMRDLPTLRGHYDSLSAKRIDSQVSANVERQQIGEQFRIFEPARVPERPFSPNRGRLYLMSMALAILVGLGTAGVFEYLDRGLRSEDDVRLALALPVLATIPVIGPAQKASFRRRIVGSAVALALTVGLGATWLVLR